MTVVRRIRPDEGAALRDVHLAHSRTRRAPLPPLTLEKHYRLPRTGPTGLGQARPARNEPRSSPWHSGHGYQRSSTYLETLSS